MAPSGKETNVDDPEFDGNDADELDRHDLMEKEDRDNSEDQEPAESPAAELTAEEALEKALAEVANYKDAALRAEAEMQNVRRRAERDVENAHKFGIERFLQNLLPVVDSLEKAIETFNEKAAADGTDVNDPVIEGVKLCHKLFLDVLQREKIEVVDPTGEPFDPNEHEAMSMVENPDMEPNSVVAVVQKGYKLNSRLVRPAMVMVSKAPAP